MPTACLHFTWRTTSLRVGGLAATPICLPGLRRGGIACATAATARRTPTQVRQKRTRLAVGPTRFTPDTTKQSSLCRVWRGGVNWTVAINVFTPHVFCLELSRRFTAKTETVKRETEKGQRQKRQLLTDNYFVLPFFPTGPFYCRVFRLPNFPLLIFPVAVFSVAVISDINFLLPFFPTLLFFVAEFYRCAIFR